jgi:hypothetical protein
MEEGPVQKTVAVPRANRSGPEVFTLTGHLHTAWHLCPTCDTRSIYPMDDSRQHGANEFLDIPVFHVRPSGERQRRLRYLLVVETLVCRRCAAHFV